MSEHEPDDELGLLSMWRAYGGPEFLQAFDQTVQRLEQNPDTLRAINPDVLKNIVYNALQFALPLREAHRISRRKRVARHPSPEGVGV